MFAAAEKYGSGFLNARIAENDVERFVDIDEDFHDVIFQATENDKLIQNVPKPENPAVSLQNGTGEER